MSRIGKQPVKIPAKVKVEIKGRECSVEGPKGKLKLTLPPRTSAKVEGEEGLVSRAGDAPGPSSTTWWWVSARAS